MLYAGHKEGRPQKECCHIPSICSCGGAGRTGWCRAQANVSCFVQDALILVVWFNKVVQAHPEAIAVDIHDVPDGDHTDLCVAFLLSRVAMFLHQSVELTRPRLGRIDGIHQVYGMIWEQGHSTGKPQSRIETFASSGGINSPLRQARLRISGFRAGFGSRSSSKVSG